MHTNTAENDRFRFRHSKVKLSKRNRTLAPLLGCAAVALYLGQLSVVPPALAEDDPDYAAMAPGPGKELAYLLCSDCHAMRQVLERRHTRSGWRKAMERMTLEFGMAELTPDETTEVLDYLANHYGPGSQR